MEYYNLLPVTVLHGGKEIRGQFMALVGSLVKKMKRNEPISESHLAESSAIRNLIREANKINAQCGGCKPISDQDFLKKSRIELAQYAISHAEDELQINHYQNFVK